MVKIVKTNGEIIDLEDNQLQLEQMQKVVGGYIEIVRLKNGWLVVCNEEGKLIGLEENPVATLVCNVNGFNDLIVGDVIICESKYIK